MVSIIPELHALGPTSGRRSSLAASSPSDASRFFGEHPEKLVTSLCGPVLPRRPLEDIKLSEFLQIFLPTTTPASLHCTSTRAYSFGACLALLPRTHAEASLALTLV